MDSRFIFKTFLFFIALSVSVIAQNADSSKIYKLSEVVVTATRTQIHEYEAASSISVIDSAQIARADGSSLFDLLKNQYGLSYSQQGAPGSLSYVYLRGADPGQTLVLIDGVDVNMPNDPSNTFDFADLPTDNIRRVEILRGPQSTLYGSNALAGVINIITKKGEGAPKYFLSAEGGSYGTYKTSAGLNGSLNKFNYSITLSKFASSGFSSASTHYGNTEKDGTANYNLSSRFGVDVARNFGINFFIRYAKAKTSLDQHGGLFGDDPTYLYNLEESSYSAEGKLSLFGGKWQQILGLSFFRNVRSYSFDSTLNNPASSSSIYDGKKIKIDWQNNLSLIKGNILTIGAGTEREQAVSNYFYNSSYSGSFESAFPNNSSNIAGVYVQDQASYAGSFFVSAGVRFDHHSRFRSVTTWRLAPAYIFKATGTKLKATYGTGFKAPSLFYLFDPAYGNANLKPEKSKGWDAGVEQYLFAYNLTAGITYFSNVYTDLFGFDNNFRTINVDRARTSGIELYASGRPWKNFNVDINYTYTDAIDESAGSADYGKQLLRRPRDKAGLNLSCSISRGINAGLDIIYVGRREDDDFSVYPTRRVTMGGYTVVNISASYRVNKLIGFYGRVNNLFNKYYEEILGYATPGLSGYLGIKLSM